ncbi:hypothetical protein HN014_13195 [Aquimarina sp. TRL1]|uniref:hypothetical protein n=1 Tax=Aquimarina sp. (strain TRL1) TaxID=2736252 RepID=UPI00158B31A3|nr:hypothetical protein [Aquimarina sp. TRL1]QKX05821.1 hypothetical protein HN014_13195 [Aquimarina sp. TRL1]
MIRKTTILICYCCFLLQTMYANFTLAGNVITQTGVDTNLSGLTGIAGVTVISNGTGANQFITYNLGNLRLVIQGTLTHNPEQEQLLFNNPGNPIIDIQNGATYNLGEDVVVNGVTRQRLGLGIFISSTDAGCCNANNAAIAIRNGATWNWRGATIDVGQLPWFAEPTSTVQITNGVLLVRRDATSDVVQVRQNSDNFFVNGLTFIGNGRGDITFLRRPQQMNNYRPETTGGAIAFSGNTPNYDVTFRGYSGGDRGNTQDIKFWQGCRPILINSKTGSQLIAGNHKNDGNGAGYGVALVYQELDLTVTDLANAPVAGVTMYIRDTNNGGRETYNREGHTVDNTQDNEYITQTDINGTIPQQQILLAANVANTGGANGLNSGTYAWDYRGKNNDDSDVFDIHLWAYNYLYQIIADAVLKGVDGTSLSTKVFDDTAISEISKTVVDGYTEINTLDQLYDRAKSFKVDNITTLGIENFFFTTNGDRLVLSADWNLVIDQNAPAAFAVDEGNQTITIRSNALRFGTKFTSIETTGTISVANGAAIEFGYIDSTGTFKYIELLDLTDTTVTVTDFVPSPEVLLQEAVDFSGTYKSLFEAPTDASNTKVKLSRFGYSEWIEIVAETDLSFIRSVELIPLPEWSDNQQLLLYYAHKILQKSEALKNVFNNPVQPTLTINNTITTNSSPASEENQEALLNLLKRTLSKITNLRERMKSN